MFATYAYPLLSEPVYKGRALSQWYNRIGGNLPKDKTHECYDAISAIGTNAIPTCIKWMSEDGKRNRRLMGADILAKLGSQARPAIPAVIQLLRHKDKLVRWRAFVFLSENFPNEKIVQEAFIPLLHDPEKNTRYYVAEFLSDIYPEEVKKIDVFKEYPHLKELVGSAKKGMETNVPSNTILEPKNHFEAGNANSKSGKQWSEMTSMEKVRALTATSPEYQKEVLNKIIKEANVIAQEWHLKEDLPILETNLVKYYITPPMMARGMQMAGNITTSNYTYCIAAGNKFSGLIFYPKQGDKKDEADLKTKYLFPMSQNDTNAAYQLSTQYLAAIKVDVPALENDSKIEVRPWMPEGPHGQHFVPLYWIIWKSKEDKTPIATMRVLLPSREIRELYIKNGEYIHRNPIELPSSDSLLSQTNAPPSTNTPATNQ